MTLQQIIGQDTIISNIRKSLTEGNTFVANIHGGPGTGKSWILDHLFENSTEYLCAIKLQGDLARQSEPFYPLNAFIEQRNRNTKRGVKAAKELIGEIPVIGSPIKGFLEDVNIESLYGGSEVMHDYQLDKHPQFATHLLSAINKYEIVALFCDDFSDFDKATPQYLNNLIRCLNSQNYKSKVLLIFSWNIQSEDGTLPINWLTIHSNEYKLNKITRQQLADVLHILKLEHKLSDSDLDVLYSSTGGHLHILKYVVGYLNKNKPGTITSQGGKTLIYSIFESRLHQVREYYNRMKELLCALGNIGKSGSKTELMCVLGESDEVSELMKYAEELDLITIRDGYLSFANESVKEYSASFDTRSKPQFYRKFSTCVKNLNPSNYMRRAWIEEKLGNLEGADIFTTLFIIQRIRLGMYDEISGLKGLFKSSDKDKLSEIIDQFLISYQLHAKGNLKEAYAAVSSINTGLPDKLLAEKIYLESEILLKRVDYVSRREALTKLDSWDVLKEEEPEQWYRFIQLRFLANAELENYENASKLEQEIVIFFSKRIRFDITAQDALNRVNLFSEIIYSPEIANVKLNLAANILGKNIESENYDKLPDYYIALCNLSGNYITNNNLTLACLYAEKAINLVRKFPLVNFSHREVPFNNLLLASHFLQKESNETITKTFEQLLTHRSQEDNILLVVNYAGILIRQKCVDEAYQLLKKAGSSIDDYDSDPFYVYHYRFNYALAIYFSGKKDDAIAILEEIKEFVPRVGGKMSSYYRKHYEITTRILRENTQLNYQQLCALYASLQPHYLGISWEKFKFVYLFTDLQIWTSN